MDFTFLFDETRKLFSIGYRVSATALSTPPATILLASEARLASFVAIAKGDAESVALVPSRPHAHSRGQRRRAGLLVGLDVRVPHARLVMRPPAESLLSETARLVVQRQIDYGTERGVPWGISESAFNARDLEMRYQYSAFGVPGLGLKRGLSEDLVIAPYATALAAMVDPVAAAKISCGMTSEGGRGAYGMYEALDYTPSRVPEGKKVAVVQAYFAHHQGMSLVALDNVLTHGAMRHALPRRADRESGRTAACRSARRATFWSPGLAPRKFSAASVREFVPPVVRRFTTAQRTYAAHASALQRPLCRDAHFGRLGL